MRIFQICLHLYLRIGMFEVNKVTGNILPITSNIRHSQTENVEPEQSSLVIDYLFNKTVQQEGEDKSNHMIVIKFGDSFSW